MLRTPVVLLIALLTAAAPVASGVAARPAALAQESPVDLAIVEAFRAAYSLDHDQALGAARRAVAIGPSESRAHRALASILWLQILFTRGAVSVDHYLGTLRSSHLNLPKPPADIEAEFQRELALATSLAAARVERNEEDAEAQFDLGAAYGLKASYIASVEGRIAAAFQAARHAFDAQEAVLELEPRRTEPGLIVGTYRYVVSTMSLPTRWFAYVAGFGGGKERGIAMIEAAARAGELQTDAKTALMVIYSREGRHADVVRLARELAAAYPRNRLFVYEEGAAAIRAGRAADAEAVLTRGLAAFDRDRRPRIPGERALWLYKRGVARLNLNRPADAHVDFNEALASAPPGWVSGRIQIELGKVADLSGRRDAAVLAYQAAKNICERERDSLGYAEAVRLMRRPFRFR
jgi:tetratricopeptide (TPR) repeat protein